MALKLITAPASEPVTIEEAKAHLRVDHGDDDTLIEALQKAARFHAEKFLGRALVSQTWDYYADAFPATGKPIELPLPPCIGVDGVFYTNADGSETEVTSGFVVDTASEPARVYMSGSAAWPTPGINALNAVRVRFRAGYVDESLSPPVGEVPEDIKAAIKLTLGTLYEHRETVIIGQTAVQLPWAAEQLLRFHRIDLSMA